MDDERFERNLRGFLRKGAPSEVPPSLRDRVDQITQASPSHRVRLAFLAPATALVTIGLAATLLAMAVGLGWLKLPVTNAPGTGPTAQTSLAESASPLATSSVVPQPTLTGDTPGPDATVPAGVGVIPGLRIDGLVGLWGSLGLTCQSWAGGLPDTPGGYTLHCDRHDASTRVDIVAEAVYWTSDGIQSFSVSVTSSDGAAIDGATPAGQIFLPSVGLAMGDVAQAWVHDQIGAAVCAHGCTQTFGTSQITVTAGQNGFEQLDVVASSAALP